MGGGGCSATRPAAEVSAWPHCQNNKRSGLGEEELVLLASRPGGKGKKSWNVCVTDGRSPQREWQRATGRAALAAGGGGGRGRGGGELATPAGRPTDHRFFAGAPAEKIRKRLRRIFFNTFSSPRPSGDAIKTRGRQRVAGNKRMEGWWGGGGVMLV